jgi:hypothetical protein
MAKVGDDAQVAFTFTTLGTDTAADPDEVYVRVRLPDLTEVQFEYLVDDEIARGATGSYTFTQQYFAPRTHVISPIGVGNVNKMQEILIEIDEPYLLVPTPE